MEFLLLHFLNIWNTVTCLFQYLPLLIIRAISILVDFSGLIILIMGLVFLPHCTPSSLWLDSGLCVFPLWTLVIFTYLWVFFALYWGAVKLLGNRSFQNYLSCLVRQVQRRVQSQAGYPLQLRPQLPENSPQCPMNYEFFSLAGGNRHCYGFCVSTTHFSF